MEEYEFLLKGNNTVRFGTRNAKMDHTMIPGVYDTIKMKKRLILGEIREFHREYTWV